MIMGLLVNHSMWYCGVNNSLYRFMTNFWFLRLPVSAFSPMIGDHNIKWMSFNGQILEGRIHRESTWIALLCDLSLKTDRPQLMFIESKTTTYSSDALYSLYCVTLGVDCNKDRIWMIIFVDDCRSMLWNVCFCYAILQCGWWLVFDVIIGDNFKIE